jgi:multisubunit Na+/H+ antiporter MnhC subunit
VIKMIEETTLVYLISYIGAIGLILLGIFAIVTFRHLIRIIFGLMLLESGINLFLIIIGYRGEAVAPILVNGELPTAAMVDPIPQALVLTAIVIGVGVQALALALVIKTYKAYGSLDTQILAQKLAEEAGTKLIDGIPAPVAGSGNELEKSF